MPVMNGFEATRKIRDWENLHSKNRIPIIALTAGVDKDTQTQCVDCGMDDFLCKVSKINQSINQITDNFELK
jgi:CheY-like chemotaxis protein